MFFCRFIIIIVINRLLVKKMDQMSAHLSISLYLSNAFDTLYHKIVLSKLNTIKHVIYLANRKQYLQFAYSCSKMLAGPLLLIYINDFPN